MSLPSWPVCADHVAHKYGELVRMLSTQSALQGTKFLVIDRDARLLKTVERYLRSGAVRSVRTAESAPEGQNILLDTRGLIDCIICAEDLAPFTGLEFLQKLRSGSYGGDAKLRGIKFIMLTAHREMELVLAAKKLDVHGYITKPIGLSSFTCHVRAAISHEIKLKRPSEYESVDIGKALGLPVMLH